VFVVYHVRDGVVDAGTFVPLDPAPASKAVTPQ